MRDCYLEDSSLMLVIELVSKWEICWALCSLVLFNPVRRSDPTQIILRVFSLFLFLTSWEFGLIPYNLYQCPFLAMIITVKCYVPEPFDIFHQVFTAPLLGCLQSCKCYCFFSMEVFCAKYVHHVIPCWDRSWL